MLDMGTITANIDDDTEDFFRKTVKDAFGEGKGKLGRALDEAMKKWAVEKSKKIASEELKQMMEKGLYKLGTYKFNREEIYDRL